jgi:hypothetical protein
MKDFLWKKQKTIFIQELNSPELLTALLMTPLFML